MTNFALDTLHRIAEATFRNAAPMPLREVAQPEWQGLGFQIGGVRLASKMGEVDELLQLPKLATLPGVKPWLLGVANIRGRLLPVVDVHQFLGLEPTTPRHQWRVLVVEDDDLIAGLLVEQSIGIQHFLMSSFESQTSDLPNALEPYVNGAFRHGGRVFYEIGLKAVLRDEKFFDVAEKPTQKSTDNTKE